MTNTEAATIVAILHGAYPGTYFDGAVAEVFTNSLMTTDFEVAHQAANEWVQGTDRFPTLAELNGLIRRIRQRGNEREIERAVVEVATKEQAAAAFERGYTRARSEAGDDMDEISRKLRNHLRAWGIYPATDAERREHAGSVPKRSVPSRHRPGYLRSNTEVPEDRPAFDASSTDEPW